MSPRRFKVLVCRGPQCGGVRNSAEVHRAVTAHIERCGLSGSVDLGWQSCFGRCTQGPNVLVRECVDPPAARTRFVFASLPARAGRSALYNHVTPSDAATIIEEHILRGKIVRKLIDAPARPAQRPSSQARFQVKPQLRSETRAKTLRPADSPNEGSSRPRSLADEATPTQAAKRTDGER